ncbi:hypothetical protein, partial [Brucella intermedia]|uniref:hypothetical protein n=1 Tax=Brucella intermedia TaxID=94625 RepID=UPI0023620030
MDNRSDGKIGADAVAYDIDKLSIKHNLIAPIFLINRQLRVRFRIFSMAYTSQQQAPHCDVDHC